MNPAGLRPPWYFNPRVFVLGVLIPIYVILYLLPEHFGVALSTAKGYTFFRGEAFLIGLAALLALGYGTLLPLHLFRVREGGLSGAAPPLAFVQAVGILSVIGYVWWFKDFAARPDRWLEMARSSSAFAYDVRRGLERTSGLASLASLGLAFFVFYAHRRWALNLSCRDWLTRWLFGALCFFTLFRSFVWAERLAFFEAMIAGIVFWLSFAPAASRGWLGRLRSFLPLFGVFFMVVLFGLGEYGRSWVAHYASTENSFWGFVAQRLLNYYYQALNSGAGLITVLNWPTYDFQYTLEWLHRFPILLGPIMRYYTQPVNPYFFERYADPEFNNPSGLFSVLYDGGLPVAIPLFALVGVLAQSSYRAMCERTNPFAIVFPLFYLTLVEFFRYFYVGSSRSFLLSVALIAAMLLARRPASDPNLRSQENRNANRDSSARREGRLGTSVIRPAEQL